MKLFSFSILNALTSRTSLRSTLEYCVSITVANALIVLISFLTSPSFSLSTKSVLFSKILSAKAICCTDSFTTPSGIFSRRCCKT